MAADNNTGAGSVMLAFLLGAVAGAAVALLYAPATGQETREFLGDRAREGRERATEAAVKGREVINRGRETAATALERGREAYQQARGTQGPQGVTSTSAASATGASPSREGA
jgi:gas vesicle protein